MAGWATMSWWAKIFTLPRQIDSELVDGPAWPNPFCIPTQEKAIIDKHDNSINVELGDFNCKI